MPLAWGSSTGWSNPKSSKRTSWTWRAPRRFALPIALANTKQLLNQAASSSLAEAIEAEARAQVLNSNTKDAAEAVRAFRDRRPPVSTRE